MSCNAIKDLLPGYIDGVVSAETGEEIQAHLDDCAECRAVYWQMTAEIANTAGVQKPENTDFLKNLRGLIKRKVTRAVVVTCGVVAVCVVGLVIFAHVYRIPIPYDLHRMLVEEVRAEIFVEEDGKSYWSPITHGLTHDSENVGYEGPPRQYIGEREILAMSYHSFAQAYLQGIGRNINRDGEEIRLVFFNMSKSPWTSLFVDYDLSEIRTSGSMTGSVIYGDSVDRLDYEPQTIEIYYLQETNLHRLERLSDDAFNAKRLEGRLMWQGVS
ncbi:MAG: zf-HC2 domain-containing protein [Oscillospiraceae bacterium]|nr:zf-HC2 domain-containing protein [Oscillospiraceae bacterium]